jgi:hypothetical protein
MKDEIFAELVASLKEGSAILRGELDASRNFSSQETLALKTTPAHETEQTRALLAQLQADLLAFEQQYQLSSAEFYQQYQAGKMDDCPDFVEWASLIQMAENTQKELVLLIKDKA